MKIFYLKYKRLSLFLGGQGENGLSEGPEHRLAHQLLACIDGTDLSKRQEQPDGGAKNRSV